MEKQKYIYVATIDGAGIGGTKYFYHRDSARFWICSVMSQLPDVNLNAVVESLLKSNEYSEGEGLACLECWISKEEIEE